MSKLYKGILEGVSGRIGNVVGRKVKNQFVITSRNSNPKRKKSSKQIQIESAMALLRGLAGFVYELVLVELIDIRNEKTTIIAKFVQNNFSFFKSFPTIVYPQITFSNGTILTTQIKNITISASNSRVRVTWDKNWVTASIEQNDSVFAVVINESQNQVAFSAALATRKDKVVDVPFIGIIGADLLHVYLCFNRGSNVLTSQTAYKNKN